MESIFVGEYKDEIDENILETPQLLRMKSSAGDISSQLKNMIDQLIKVFNKQKNPQNLKIAASHLLVNSAKYIPNVVVGQFQSILPIIKIYFQTESAQSELKVNLLISLKRLLRSQIHSHSHDLEQYFSQILEIIQKAINHSHFKISSEGFRLLSTFYRILRPNRKEPTSNYDKYIKLILTTVIGRLKETDIDQEVMNNL